MNTELHFRFNKTKMPIYNFVRKCKYGSIRKGFSGYKGGGQSTPTAAFDNLPLQYRHAVHLHEKV